MTLQPLPCGVTGAFCARGALAGLGECIVAGDGDGGLVIVRADPRIAVSGLLLRDWHDATPPCISLECQGYPDCLGDVIRVGTAAGRVVYVVTGPADRMNDVWEARWPD